MENRVIQHGPDKLGYARWHDFPLGMRRGGGDDYDQRFYLARDAENPAIDALEQALGYEIPKDFLEHAARNIQISLKQSFPDFSHGRVLYAVLSDYLGQYYSRKNGAITIFETGTAKGFSLLCMAKAMKDAQAPGKIITFDIIPHDIAMYWNCVVDHEKGSLTRSELLIDWASLIDEYALFVEGNTKITLNKVHASRINFAFLDGGHTYEDVCFEFGCISSRQKAGDVLLFDDYNHVDFPGIVEAVDEMTDKAGYTKNVISLTGNRSMAICKKH
jgi:hypothetical protein